MDDCREDVKYQQVPADDDQLLHKEIGINIVASDEKKYLEELNSNKNGEDRRFLYIAACVANLTAFFCGTALGWTSPIIPKLNGNVEPLENPLSVPLDMNEESWVGSLLPVGASLGPFVAGMMIDKVGRKKTLLASTLPFIIAFAMAAFATNSILFFIVRFLCGLAVGGVFTVLPIYVAEISDDQTRGALGSFMQLFITMGILFSYGIGPYMSITTFNIACIIVPVLFVPIFLVYIPESPYYLIAKADSVGARKALSKLRTKSGDDVGKEMLHVEESVKEATANNRSFMYIFKSRGLTKALILSVGLVALQQFSGINVILFYTQTIFEATGSGISAELSTIIIGIVQFLSSFLTPLLVDKLGKRYLLIYSAIGMCVSEAILGCYFYLKDSTSDDVQSVFWLPILCLVGYNITYCMGFGPLPWAVMGELFPGDIKSAASTVTASGCWILAFLITKFYGNVALVVGIAGSFWIFAGFCAFAALFVYFFLPETTGKSLQEIQDILNNTTA